MTGRGPGGRSWIEHMMERSENLQRESDAAIETAKRLGTYDAIDRSKQYERADNRELLRAVNEAWSKIRACEKQLRAKDTEIGELKKTVGHYHLVNIALISIITGLAWEGIKAVATHLIR